MARDLLSEIGTRFEAHRHPERGAAMSAYMRDLFAFYGIPAPMQRAIAREVLTEQETADEAQLRRIALACWERPEWVWQYFGCDLLVRNVKRTSSRFLPTVKKLITNLHSFHTRRSSA